MGSRTHGLRHDEGGSKVGLVVARTRAKLCILTKPLLSGRNKTRLVPQLGERRVSELARAFLLDTYRSARKLERAEVILALSEPGPLPPLQPKPRLWEQGSGDLGERMGRVARRALAEGAPWVILLGSDSPGLPESLLREAVAALESNHHAVIGPAEDGGYYLLGLTRCPEHLLSGLPWSSRETRAETLARLEQYGLSTRQIRPWFDVDHPRDVDRLQQELARGRIDAPATARVLMPEERR